MQCQYSIILSLKTQNISNVLVWHPACKSENHNIVVRHAEVNMWKKLLTEIYTKILT